MAQSMVEDLERLNSVETMYFRGPHLRYFNQLNDYSIFTDTKELYQLKELEREIIPIGPLRVSPWITVQGLIPSTGEQAFLIRRAAVRTAERMEIYMGDDELVNVVRMKSAFSNSVIHIKDSYDEMVLRLKIQTNTRNYLLQTKEKVTIGSIFKVTCKSPEELLDHLDDYVMKVPAEMTSELKVAVIVACYLILFTFSRSRGTLLISKEVKLFMDDVLISVISLDRIFLKPILHINDAHDNLVMRLKGQATDLTFFQLQTNDKTATGSVQKKFRGWTKEMSSNKDDYIISVPVDLAVPFKIAVIVACIYIDFRFHEGK